MVQHMKIICLAVGLLVTLSGLASVASTTIRGVSKSAAPISLSR